MGGRVPDRYKTNEVFAVVHAASGYTVFKAPFEMLAEEKIDAANAINSMDVQPDEKVELLNILFDPEAYGALEEL